MKNIFLGMFIALGLITGSGLWAINTETGQQFTAEQFSRGMRFNLSQRPIYYARVGLDGEWSYFKKGCYIVRTDQVELVANDLGLMAREWLPYKMLKDSIEHSGAQFQLTEVNKSFCLTNLPPLYVQSDGDTPELTTYDPDAWQKGRSWIPNGSVKPGTPCMRPENMVRLPNNYLVWNSQGKVGAVPCSPVEPPVSSS